MEEKSRKSKCEIIPSYKKLGHGVLGITIRSVRLIRLLPNFYITIKNTAQLTLSS